MFLNKYNIALALICTGLIVFIFKWGDYLAINEPILEYFASKINTMQESSSTSHSVDLPLTTTHSCNNFCGPTARCSVTGQQCLADVDCPGCQPNVPPLPKTSEFIPGDNDAGKLTLGVTPQYSSLTNGYGTNETIITNNMYSKPSSPNFGANTWTTNFKQSEMLFNKRYKQHGMQNEPSYQKRYSLTGEFVEDGPMASNAQLS